VLVRMNGRAANATKPNWLLIKERDKFARTAQKTAVTEASPYSVVTARSLEQIASDEDHVWNSKASSSPPAKPIEPSRPHKLSSKKTGAPQNSESGSLGNLPRENLPRSIPPRLALTTRQPTATDVWLHELKLDGYRIQIHVRETKSRGKQAHQGGPCELLSGRHWLSAAANCRSPPEHRSLP